MTYKVLNHGLDCMEVGENIISTPKMQNNYFLTRNRSHEPIYKTDTKNEAKTIKATTFAKTKLEERYLQGEQ